jgi:hypothetical protein
MLKEFVLLCNISEDVEIALAKLKNCKLPGSEQISAELIQAGGETLWAEIHKLILFGMKKNYRWRILLRYQFTRSVMKL